MIYREQLLKFLQEQQETEGGYTGNDITKLAELLQVTPRGLRKRLSLQFVPILLSSSHTLKNITMIKFY